MDWYAAWTRCRTIFSSINFFSRSTTVPWNPSLPSSVATWILSSPFRTTYDDVRAPRNDSTLFEARSREFRKGNAATPSPPATNNAVSYFSSPYGNTPFPNGPSTSRVSPAFFCDNNLVPSPTTLKMIETTSPSTEKMLNGRRRSGTADSSALTLTNCPGRALREIEEERKES